MTRRKFLTGIGTSVGLICAGCLGSPSLTPTEESTPDVEPSSRLGQAPRISFEARPREEYEYLEESDRIRIQYDSGDSSTFEFEWWGTARAAEHGAARLQRLLEDRSLSGDGISTGWGKMELAAIDVPAGGDPPTQEEFERGAPLCPKVFHIHHYARDGSLISNPDVPFQRIVTAVPRAMEVTMLFPEKEYTAVLPAVCNRTVQQNE